MATSKKFTLSLGYDYSNKMRSSYAEIVKPSGKNFTKSDWSDSRMKDDMKENSKEKKIKEVRYHGECLCGAVKFQVDGQMRQIINCHCDQCRRTHGHYAAYSSAEKSKFKFIHDKGLKWFRSSEKAKRGFCQVCGASLFYELIGDKNISIAAGMLDSTAGLKTVSHIFMTDKPDYYLIDDDLPKYDKYFENGL